MRVGSSETLFVDDDGPGENERAVLEGLAHAGRFCHFVKSADLDEAKASRYMNIIWVTGEEFAGTLDGKEQEFLARYLEKGGHLLLIGDNIGDDLGQGAFYKDYLHAKVIKETLSGNYDKIEYKVFGKDGDRLSRRMVIPTFINYKQYDLIRPLEGADDPFQGERDEFYMGFVRYSGTYKTIYTSLGMEAIEDIAVRAQLLDRILEWFEEGKDRP